MSIDGLVELMSVSNKAVKTLDKSESSASSDKFKLFTAGSPFESPRSLNSVSDKSEHLHKNGIESTQVSVPLSGSSKSVNGVQNTENREDETGQEVEDVTVIEIIPCKIVTSEIQQHGQDDENIINNINNNNNNIKKVSVSRKHLREIISPRDGGLNEIPYSPHDSQSSKMSHTSGKERHHPFQKSIGTKEIRRTTDHEPRSNTENLNSNNNRIVGSEKGESSVETVSLAGDQPEIVDVYEQIITVTTGMSQSSDATMVGLLNKIEESHKTHGSRNGNSDHNSMSKNVQSYGLRQGSLNKGFVDPTKTSSFDDVQISQLGLTEKQRSLKEAFARRSENKKPKKKFVQPQIIQSKLHNNRDAVQVEKHDPSDSRQAVSNIDPAVTAAAAASVAVAAAQPFLKTQHELEAKMHQLLTQIVELQQKTGITEGERKMAGSESRILELERQVAELNERRFEHLENMQQQQMQLQAQLLFMSRSRSPNSQMPKPGRQVSSSRQIPTSHIPQSVGKQAGISFQRADTLPGHNVHPQNALQAKLSFNPSTQSHVMYNSRARGQPMYNYNTQKQAITNPDIVSKHHNYLNEVRELQGSHLDTPAPRSRVPKPTPYALPQEPQKNLGFLEELLSHETSQDKDTTFSVKGDHSSPTGRQDRNNSARGRRPDQSPVDKARQLVRTLSNLEKETAESVWGSRDDLIRSSLQDVDLGPAPLEHYLKYPKKEGSPYPKLSQHSREKKAMLHNLDNLLEAKNILRQLETTHETLEKNIEQVVRSRRDVHVFSTLLGSGSDGATDEQLRIEKMVAKKISALEEDVQREALRVIAQTEAEKLAAKQELEQQKLAARYKVDQARSGSSKGQAESSARLAYEKPNLLAVKSLAVRGKENRTSKVKPPPKPIAIKDEATRVRTYGKPEYQRGRTTIRDPYLHFQNTKKGVAAKSSVTNLNESARSREGRSRSPPSRQGQGPFIDPMPRQFYFSPTRGYIPLGAGDTAPVQGQLISMAIPLGAPRLEAGVRRSAVTMTTRVTDPVSSTPIPVTAETRNAALVSFSVEDARQDRERMPEMTKQVLPPVDIDSISPSSSRRSDIHIRSPQQDNANVTLLYSTRNIKGMATAVKLVETNKEEESDLDRTLTEESSDLEQAGEGIRLPGYEPKNAEYSGPAFPPSVKRTDADWAAAGREGQPGGLVSDVMAEDLRRRDVLENNAVMWLEQELMARILSQVIPLQEPEKSDASPAESEAGDQDESLLAADMIGQSGMQIFIDAGQPVDNALVQQLIKEVIQEKINAMLAQRVAEGVGQADQVKVRSEVEEAIEEREREKIAAGPARVPTPEPTPRASPVPSPKPTIQQPLLPATPTSSPPPAGYRFKPTEPELPEPVRQPMTTFEPQVLINPDLESETSVSIDISEELNRVAAKSKPLVQEEQVVICNDVATPTPSPPPIIEDEKSHSFPSRPATPTLSLTMTKTLPEERMSSLKRKEPVRTEEEESAEEETIEEPRPVMMSVGVGDDRPMKAEAETQHRSPAPERPPTPDSTASESASPSTESTTTDTVNEFISEGQWLLSYSEGQFVGAVNYEAIRKEIVGKGYQHIIDVSTASTLRDMDDLDLDAEGTKSEGEFLYGAVPDPGKDPRLEVLAQMQERHILGPNARQILSGHAPRVPMSDTGRSVGELSVGQIPSSRVASEQARRSGGHRPRERRSPSPTAKGNLDEIYRYKREIQEKNHDSEHQQHSRTPSPQHKQRTGSPTKQGQLTRTPSPLQQQRSRTPPQQNRTQQQQQETKGLRPRSQMQYQPVLSEGRPLTSRGRTLPGQQIGQRRSSESRHSQSSDPGMRRSPSSYHSESLSRSADAEPLQRSADGFLASSLKSRQSGIKKSVEFDLSGTQKSNMKKSWDSSGHMSDRDHSAGLTYTEESLDESELRRIVVGTGSDSAPYRMSVTIPSGADEEESELSEIDISNKNDI